MQKIIFLFALLCLAAITPSAIAQQKEDSLQTADSVSVEQRRLDAIEKSCLSKIAEGFQVVKTYRFNVSTNPKEGYKINQNYIFSSTAQYNIAICGEWEEDRMPVIYVFDSRNNKIAESKNGSVSIKPQQGGIVRIVYDFKNPPAQLLGVSIIASAPKAKKK
ncbi:MAG: hypothetical protein KatS3mg033_2482 [Thermonema sp.]|uniref:hypothetical protein n=1 Tax=Thermonema sp. TaxID=2231181 RepID=UPI0021DC888D|nr:hypothetical protein [Thermonema sp.]GIV40682.1 MAG: hypothetical protein KatS3mg033_2482 [Thermonema sp.]